MDPTRHEGLLQPRPLVLGLAEFREIDLDPQTSARVR